MEYYVGLDVGLEETSVCIVDSEGKTVREVKVSTEPAAKRAAVFLRRSRGASRGFSTPSRMECTSRP
jgi:predicted NBD/HSP70 family sugar kinase